MNFDETLSDLALVEILCDPESQVVPVLRFGEGRAAE